MKKYLFATATIMSFSSYLYLQTQDVYATTIVNGDIQIVNSNLNSNNLDNLDNLENLEEVTADIIDNNIKYVITTEATKTTPGELKLIASNNLKDLVIPDYILKNEKLYYVTQIADNIFYNDSNLETVKLSQELEILGENNFINCKNLTDISVIITNKYFKTQDGILFNANQSELLIYPAGKTNEKYLLQEKVTKIGDKAFYGAEHLQIFDCNIILESIGDLAFSNASKLESILNIEKVKNLGKYSFANTNISSIQLPPSLTEIPEGCFYNTKFKTISFPMNITTIGKKAFEDCLELEDVSFAEKTTTIQEKAFSNSNIKKLTFPSKLNIIEKDAFSNCSNLEDILFNEVLSEIQDGAFSNCNSLESIVLNRGLKILGIGVFLDSTNIKEISTISKEFSIIDGVLYNSNGTEFIYYPPQLKGDTIKISKNVDTIRLHSMGDIPNVSSFSVDNLNKNFLSYDGILFTTDKKVLIRYPELKAQNNLVLDEHIEEILTHAFANSKNIKGVVSIDSKLTKIGELAFENTPQIQGFRVNTRNPIYSGIGVGLYTKDGKTLVRYPEAGQISNLTLSRNVEKIESMAFEGVSLISLKIYGNVTTIEENTFKNAKISNITIFEGLTTIEKNAFSNMTLNTINLPSTVNSIGNNAFAECRYIFGFDIKSSNLDEIGEDIFKNTFLRNKFKVPAGCIDLYKEYFSNQENSEMINIILSDQTEETQVI